MLNQPLAAPVSSPERNLQLFIRRMNNNDNHQRSQHDGQRNQCNQYNRPATGREFPLNHPLLSAKVPPSSQQQREDADAEERRAQRLPQASEGSTVRVAIAVRYRRVEPEELCDGHAD